MNRFALLALSFLVACATEKNFNELAVRNLDLTETQLIDRMGPPSDQYETDEALFLTWERSALLQPSYQSTVVGDTVLPTPIGGGTVHCAITYKLERKEVIDLTSPEEESEFGFVATSYRYEGNGCRA